MSPLVHAKRNDVFTALFNFCLTATPPVGTHWKETGQFLKMWDEVEAVNQPAMFLHRGQQDAEQKHAFGVTRWQWYATLWIYFRSDGLKTANTYPDQMCDQFLDNLELLFQTDPMVGSLTLGGLVTHVWIDGPCIADPGLTDNQGVVVVPLSILI